jgi:hypothetical protein
MGVLRGQAEVRKWLLVSARSLRSWGLEGCSLTW